MIRYLLVFKEIMTYFYKIKEHMSLTSHRIAILLRITDHLATTTQLNYQSNQMYLFSTSLYLLML